MLVHVALDAYAFVGTHMFDTNDQIVRMNGRAADLFADTFSDTIPVPLRTALGVELESLRTAGETDFDTPNTRTFGVSYTPLADPSGDAVGSMSILYDATVEWTVTPSDLQARTDPVLVSMLLSNLVENAIVHSESPAPTVEMEASEPSNSDEEVAIEVRDTNDQIPKIEVESHRAGDETPLQHGQDVGLWIVHWCLTKLRGSLEFEYDGGNHLTVTVPGGPTRQERQRADTAE
jgi:signal transduction histidine kinase